jgi:hypothetical protein
MRHRSFSEFYPFYLAEHAHPVSRRLHFLGTSIALALLLAAVSLGSWKIAVVALVQGYMLAWIGHFFFEHNRPATFRYPLWSFLGDWRMWWDILRGRIKI